MQKKTNQKKKNQFSLQEDLQWPGWVHSTSQVSHLLTVFNSSINFYIYVGKQGWTKLFPSSFSARLEITDMVVQVLKSRLLKYSHLL